MAVGIGSIWLLQSDLCEQEIRGIVCGAYSCRETWWTDSRWKKNPEKRRRGDQRGPKKFPSAFRSDSVTVLALQQSSKKKIPGSVKDGSELVQHQGFVQADSCLKQSEPRRNSSYLRSPVSKHQGLRWWGHLQQQLHPPLYGSLMRNIWWGQENEGLYLCSDPTPQSYPPGVTLTWSRQRNRWSAEDKVVSGEHRQWLCAEGRFPCGSSLNEVELSAKTSVTLLHILIDI